MSDSTEAGTMRCPRCRGFLDQHKGRRLSHFFRRVFGATCGLCGHPLGDRTPEPTRGAVDIRDDLALVWLAATAFLHWWDTGDFPDLMANDIDPSVLAEAIDRLSGEFLDE